MLILGRSISAGRSVATAGAGTDLAGLGLAGGLARNSGRGSTEAGAAAGRGVATTARGLALDPVLAPGRVSAGASRTGGGASSTSLGDSATGASFTGSGVLATGKSAAGSGVSATGDFSLIDPRPGSFDSCIRNVSANWIQEAGAFALSFRIPLESCYDRCKSFFVESPFAKTCRRAIRNVRTFAKNKFRRFAENAFPACAIPQCFALGR